VQNCYLKYSLSGSSGSATSASSPSAVLRQNMGQVTYNEPTSSNRQILESGTKDPNALPSALYGCPYPATADGECKPPPSCNCYQGACYGSC
jgi:hypothetical protein